eukprot:5287181-Amphidinium_carterae.1
MGWMHGKRGLKLEWMLREHSHKVGSKHLFMLLLLAVPVESAPLDNYFSTSWCGPTCDIPLYQAVALDGQAAQQYQQPQVWETLRYKTAALLGPARSNLSGLLAQLWGTMQTEWPMAILTQVPEEAMGFCPWGRFVTQTASLAASSDIGPVARIRRHLENAELLLRDVQWLQLGFCSGWPIFSIFSELADLSMSMDFVKNRDIQDAKARFFDMSHLSSHRGTRSSGIDLFCESLHSCI